MEYFFSFLRNPTYNETVEKFNLKNFLSLFFLYFIISIPVGAILLFLFNALNFDHKAMNLSIHEKIIYGILISPVIEEFLFRLILVFNKKNLIILINTVAILLIIFIIKGDIIKEALFLFLLIIFLTIYLNTDKCSHFFRNYFKSFFFLIAALFALLHLFNFMGISESNLIFMPLFVIPQFVLGLVLGYIRITYGLLYAILFHLLVNCVVII